MPAFGLAAVASALVRAASLNLCTDEYLLALAEPAQIVSLSYLSHSPHETSLWRQARRAPANAGTLESVLRHRPTLVLAMGASGQDSARIARRMGIRVVNLPYPASIDHVLRQATQVSDLLGTPSRARQYRQRVELLRGIRGAERDAAFVAGNGLSLAPQSLGAEWMKLAGYKQRALPGARLTLETLATNPPKWLILSKYRAGQYSRGQAWLRHPLVRRQFDRTLVTDGRPWTCAGLPMIAEVERLRRLSR